MYIGKEALEIYLKAVIKSNLVCGDIKNIDTLRDEILSDIMTGIDEFLANYLAEIIELEKIKCG